MNQKEKTQKKMKKELEKVQEKHVQVAHFLYVVLGLD